MRLRFPYPPRVPRSIALGIALTVVSAFAFGSGALWIANRDDQTVGRVDPKSLRTLANIPLPSSPMGLATAADGIWVVELNVIPGQSSVTASRIDPEYNEPGLPMLHIGNVVPDGPGAVAAQGHSVWVAPSNGLLTRLDALTGAVRVRCCQRKRSTAFA